MTGMVENIIYDRDGGKGVVRGGAKIICDTGKKIICDFLSANFQICTDLPPSAINNGQPLTCRELFKYYLV